jgi:hypothetical protein
MFLYAQVVIDSQPITFAALITGVSSSSRLTYTLVPTTAFTKNDEITFLSVEKAFNSSDYIACYHNITDDFYSDTKILKIWTADDLEGIDYKKSIEAIS